MGLTRLCLKNPAAAGVVLAIITLLGGLSNFTAAGSAVSEH